MRMVDLVEAPEKVGSSEFGLDDNAVNRKFTAERMAKVTEVIRDDPEVQLVRTGDGDRGWFLLFNKETKLSDYVVQYQTGRWKWLPQTVTQCILWRRLGGAFTRGITASVFFDILLPRYGAIMSDRQQTSAGHNYWIDRMADAVLRSKRVGLANMATNTVAWYEGKHTDVVAWTKDTFGEGERYQNLRYVIMN